jgi:hypothetical protein
VTVVLSQIAPWNPRLGNPYRTRWAQVGDRRFKVSSDSLDGLWMVDEVDEDGEPLGYLDRTGSDWKWVSGGLSTFAFTLREARSKIEEATEVSSRQE